MPNYAVFNQCIGFGVLMRCPSHAQRVSTAKTGGLGCGLGRVVRESMQRLFDLSDDLSIQGII